MKTIEILGEKAEYYLSHVCRTIDKSQLYLPAPDTVDKVWIESDRNIRTLGSLNGSSPTGAWPVRAMSRSCP